ncbi:hypothetical protein G7046_g2925 [Stylonectria norvegica]|nr:hypothetical protein G7046_g2925 [Stylonectria norvegica]
MWSQLLFIAAVAPAALATIDMCGASDTTTSDGFSFSNNEWGASSGVGSQCSYLDSINTGGVSWRTVWDWSQGTDSVKSYAHSGRVLVSKKLITSIVSIPTVASWSYKGSNIRADVAYDLFTAANKEHSLIYGDYELMIWLARIGGVYPIGPSQGIVTIGGQTWELFKGLNTKRNMTVFTYVATTQRTSWNSDIKPFFNHMASAHGYPASSQYLLTLEFGTEPFTGSGATFTVGHWDAHLNL